MKRMTLRDILFQFKWDTRFLEQIPFIRITFIHRGIPTGQKGFAYAEIKRLEGKFIVYNNEDGEETWIPMHRVLLVKNIETNQIFYQKRGTTEKK